jgi:NSS family neurotransmitter:Na+ symporter
VQAAGTYLFQTRWDQFGLDSLIHALMQAVMTLLAGFGVAATYSAFASDHLPIGRALGAIAVFDMAFALLAALIIFPVLFAQALLPSMGPSLLFIAIPQAYGSSVEGDFMGGLFMLVVLLLLLGVIVGLAQVLVSIISHRTKLGQRAASAVCVVLVALLVLGAYHIEWQGVRLNSWIVIALTDRLITTLLVPLILFGFCVLVGWRAYRKGLLMALDRESRLFLVTWIFLLRYVVPLGSVVLLVLGWLVYQ